MNEENKERVIERMLSVLNRIRSKDPKAANRVFNGLIECNQALADDPVIQVRSRGPENHVGVTGILNGILQEALELDRPPIAKTITEQGQILAFIRFNPKRKEGG